MEEIDIQCTLDDFKKVTNCEFTSKQLFNIYLEITRLGLWNNFFTLPEKYSFL